MRMIPWTPIARRKTDDPAVEEKLLGLAPSLFAGTTNA